MLLLVLALGASTSGAARVEATAPPKVFFDDFTYAGLSPLLRFRRHGWKIRTERGWPGVPGAAWSVENVSFVRDPANAKNRLLRMTSSTNGTSAGTKQTQICQRRKFLAGTWATRVRFRDAPSGLDGDQVVQTFYGISPLAAPLDPDFSELDWEYLPNGGWGRSGPTLWTTTWETARLEPWLAVNTTNATSASRDGWHTLVTQVGGLSVTYYIDGARHASHGGTFYPEVPMSINFNLWFIDGGLLAARQPRSYTEDVDWVFHQAGVSLSPSQVGARVRALRKAGAQFRDTVPAPRPPLDSPCNL